MTNGVADGRTDDGSVEQQCEDEELDMSARGRACVHACVRADKLSGDTHHNGHRRDSDVLKKTTLKLLLLELIEEHLIPCSRFTSAHHQAWLSLGYPPADRFVSPSRVCAISVIVGARV